MEAKAPTSQRAMSQPTPPFHRPSSSRRDRFARARELTHRARRGLVDHPASIRPAQRRGPRRRAADHEGGSDEGRSDERRPTGDEDLGPALFPQQHLLFTACVPPGDPGEEAGRPPGREGDEEEGQEAGESLHGLTKKLCGSPAVFGTSGAFTYWQKASQRGGVSTSRVSTDSGTRRKPGGCLQQSSRLEEAHQRR